MKYVVRHKSISTSLELFLEVYKYDIPSFFNYFDFINVSRFAAMAGINESKMRQYKTGLAYPGEKTTKKIFSVIQKIGSDISNVSL